MTSAPAPDTLDLTPYQRRVADWWNHRSPEDDRANLALGAIDGLYHHHYGIGEAQREVLTAPPGVRDGLVLGELHRLETAQADLLLDQLGPIQPDHRLLDAGCGRGATAVMAHRRFGCAVDGVTISAAQVEFATAQTAQLGVPADRVRFHLASMLDTEFDTDAFQGIWTNETTMYVDLGDLFGEVTRMLVPGGRYVCITGCHNDVWGGHRSTAVHAINAQYDCDVHARSDYFDALANNGLLPVRVEDLTAATLPYWELRNESTVRTGVEEYFLTAYREGSFQYLLIVADTAS